MKLALSVVLALLLSPPVLCDQVVRILRKPALSYPPLSVAVVTTLAQRGVTILDDYGPFAIALAADGLDLASAGSSADLTIAPEPDAYRVDMYIFQGGYVYCDGQYGGHYATRSTGCWFPDMYNNVKRTRIAPNSFSGQFTIQVVAGSIAGQAVPGLDGVPNQDWALYVWNAIPNF